MNLTQKILQAHLLEEADITKIPAGQEINIRIDQTLTQDATGTMTWLQFEALGVESVKTELSISYVDHNTLQMGFKNSDDHDFLQSTAAKFNAIFSPPGTGICHQLHLENFGIPGKTLVGSDSHTPTGGGIGMIAMGAGGLSVALAMAGLGYTLPMPKVVGVKLTNSLQGFAQAKDITLYLLKMLSVKGGVGKIIEYYGEGVKSLSVPERATITNMGAELGATTSIFPSDDETKKFLTAMERERDFIFLNADDNATYDEYIEIDLSTIVPMAACHPMPDNVKTIAELAKENVNINQVCIGSCTNSSYADISYVAQALKGKHVDIHTDVNLSPGSRQVLRMLSANGQLETLIDSGVRLLECSCGPCIGMGSSPRSGGVSVRTFNRNFDGRSGTKDAQIYLVSPVTAAFCALNGTFTDPSTWASMSGELSFTDFPKEVPSIRHHFIYPDPNLAKRKAVEIKRGPNIVALQNFDTLPDNLNLETTICLNEDITTDHIMPAGAEITSLRSNIPAISRHVFERVDPEFANRCDIVKEAKNHSLILTKTNYGQGSSREHAALAPRHLGVRVVLAQSFARIHRANLVNFGIIPLLFEKHEDYDRVKLGTKFTLDLKNFAPQKTVSLKLENGEEIPVINDLTEREWDIIKSGGFLNYIKKEIK